MQPWDETEAGEFHQVQGKLARAFPPLGTVQTKKTMPILALGEGAQDLCSWEIVSTGSPVTEWLSSEVVFSHHKHVQSRKSEGGLE